MQVKALEDFLEGHLPDRPPNVGCIPPGYEMPAPGILEGKAYEDIDSGEGFPPTGTAVQEHITGTPEGPDNFPLLRG